MKLHELFLQPQSARQLSGRRYFATLILMHVPSTTLTPDSFPALLKEIADPPKQLYLRGSLPKENYKLLAVVGSRTYSPYGRDVCRSLIAGLSGYPVSIVSGLALGIDSIAHKAALEANMHTLAIPGSGLDDSVLYPRSHVGLAHEILEAGGGLLSEFEPTFRATKWSFPKRNRLMAGMTHATLVIEASAKSGTLITSRLAMEYNRDVLAVPGSLYSKNSEGPHSLIKQGATPITSSEDILEVLGITHDAKDTTHSDLTQEEQQIYAALDSPLSRDSLSEKLAIDIQILNSLLMKLQLSGVIEESNGMLRRKM